MLQCIKCKYLVRDNISAYVNIYYNHYILYVLTCQVHRVNIVFFYKICVAKLLKLYKFWLLKKV